MRLRLLVRPGFKQDMDRLYEQLKQDPISPPGPEFQAAVDALRTLRQGREDEYEGKQLGYGQPYQQAVSFGHRSQDPAAIAGERLGRERGLPQQELHGLTGGGHPDVGPERPGAQTTPCGDPSQRGPGGVTLSHRCTTPA